MKSNFESLQSHFFRRDHDRIFAVGDIHGDPLVLLYIGLITSSFEHEDGYVHLKELIHIHTNYEKTLHENSIGLQNGLNALHWKKDCKDLLILNGDVLDNFRTINDSTWESSKDPFGHMVMDAEKMILDTLCRLKREAVSNGGNIIWVLGNHDVSNVIGTMPCYAYTSLDQCESTNRDQFKMERRKWVQEAMYNMQACAVCMVDNAILCHGGISNMFLQHVRRFYFLSENEKVDIQRINDVYRIALCPPHENDHLGLIQHKYCLDFVFNTVDGNDITWYRPLLDGIQWDGSVLKQIYSKDDGSSPDVLFVAHTIVSLPNIYKPHGSKNIQHLPYENYDVLHQHIDDETESVTDVFSFSTNSVVGIDFGMSRAFDVILSGHDYCNIALVQLFPPKRKRRLYKQCSVHVRIHSFLHPRCV